MKYIVGIDLGGMSAKAALFDENGKITAKKSVATDASDGFEGIAKKLADLAEGVAKEGGADFADVSAIGIASPGVVNSKTGVVLKWSNYDWENVPLGGRVSELTGKRTAVVNDANAAAYGESEFGAGVEYKDSIFITLGTGVGGGIIMDGRLVEGYMSAGAEIGHMTIVSGGELCTCGKRGCFERYASATALILRTKKKMKEKENLTSKMWEVANYSLDNVDGRTAFTAAAEGDVAAQQVVDEYVHYLAVGIANLVNILRPEAIILGGGISNQGESLFVPLREAVSKEIYVASEFVPLKIIGAKLGNEAGMYGAYCAAKQA